MFVPHYRHPGKGRDPRTRGHGASRRDPGLRRGDGQKRKREDGFTLVEMMVVIVIIGLLATIVIINVMPAADRAAVTKARADISVIDQAVQLYRIDNLRYPTSEEGIQALVTAGHLRRVENDPWGRPYLYTAPGQGGQPYAISTLGADG
ncbi:MAG: type II secretion system major pseudopilin GspG, partial [Sphingosinicella sp.]|uniref:type II secretion system major pseudopilin GspG n=1 Tax=Sphingosinicella sp. TaxID=1917971 RepID=UPI004037A3ED